MAAVVETMQRIAAECTTKGTELSGKRNACWSDTSTLEAPDGYVFNEKGATLVRDERNGSENHIYLNWHDYEEIAPGYPIESPTRVTLSVHARSPKGHDGQRGWTKVTYEIPLLKKLA